MCRPRPYAQPWPHDVFVDARQAAMQPRSGLVYVERQVQDLHVPRLRAPINSQVSFRSGYARTGTLSTSASSLACTWTRRHWLAAPARFLCPAWCSCLLSITCLSFLTSSLRSFFPDVSDQTQTNQSSFRPPPTVFLILAPPWPGSIYLPFGLAHLILFLLLLRCTSTRVARFLLSDFSNLSNRRTSPTNLTRTTVRLDLFCLL